MRQLNQQILWGLNNNITLVKSADSTRMYHFSNKGHFLVILSFAENNG